MEDILYRYNPWWEGGFDLKGAIERPAGLDFLTRNFSSPGVVFLSGLRRVGKTTLLKLFIKNLIDSKKVTAEKIFYVSLDDYLLSKKSIIEIVQEYRKTHKLSYKEKVVLFLDEVAFKDDFELQLKNLYDSQAVKIYASSSSASILKSKKAYLTGRNMVYEVSPLNFSEYLEFKKIKISKADGHLRERYFEDYLKTGGLPEYVLRGDMDYLKELVDDIIYKDIVAFHGVKNPQVVKDFFVLLMERAGKAASINKMANILNISPDTANRYLQIFADVYLIYPVQRYGKTNARLLSPRKIYAADLGIRSLFTGFRDKGSLFENYVYLQIKDKNPRYVYEDETEIDFFTSDKTLIEVKYGLGMNLKQQALFKSFEARKKIIIKNINELESFLSKQS